MINFKKLLETNLPPTDVDAVTFTDESNLYVTKTDGSQLKIGDVLLVTSLPETGIEGKLYLLYDLDNDIFSLYVWNGIVFKRLAISN